MKNVCIVIDPSSESLNKVEAPEVIELDDMLSNLECEMVERIPIANGVDLWLDEEGQLNNASERVGHFNLGTWQFVGKGLICLYNLEGDSLAMNEATADEIISILPVNF